MNQPNSSTSSSERPPHSWKRAVSMSAWAAVFLLLFDIGANVLFSYPTDPRNLSPNRLQLYFDYGRSMEGRLRRATRADPSETAPITLAGWYDPLEVGVRDPKPSGRVVTIYGNSHSVRLADALQASSPTFSVRSVAGPGATANWAYGAYLRDEGKTQGDAVILTIMPSNLPMILTMSAMTWNQSFAMPFTSDVFIVEDGGLTRRTPPYESFGEYIEVLSDDEKWEEAQQVFAAYDPFYDRFLFQETPLDASTIVRLLRRGWAQRRDARVRASSLGPGGYDPNDEAVLVANGIVSQFAETARADGLIPIIYIVNSRGYGDQMFRALADTLREENIPYVSSHDYVDPNDPRNYLPDAHFTDANDLKLARQVEEVVKRESARSRITEVSRQLQGDDR